MAQRAETEPEPAEPAEGEGEGEEEEEAEPTEGVTPDASGEPQIPAGYQLCGVCAGAGIIPDDVRPDPTVQTCATCNGRGQVLTGSLVPDYVLQACPECQGRGHVPRQQPQPAYAPPPPPPPAYAPTPPSFERDYAGPPPIPPEPYSR